MEGGRAGGRWEERTTSTRTSPTSTWPLSCADEFSVKAAAAATTVSAAAAAAGVSDGHNEWGLRCLLSGRTDFLWE